MRFRFFSLLFLPAAILWAVSGSAAAGSPQAVNAQTGETWNPPALLYTAGGDMFSPLLVSDQTGRLHLFWGLAQAPNVQNPAGGDILFYNQKVGDSWSVPVDILSGQEIQTPSVTVDKNNTLHLVWLGTNRQMYYSQAPVEQAAHVRGWTPALPIAAAFDQPHILADASGRLHIVYSAASADGINYITSEDGGAHWSFPQHVSGSLSAYSGTSMPRIAVTGDGTLHVVWTEYRLPSGWPPTGVFYARSVDQGQTWTRAAMIMGEGYDQINIAAQNNRTIHVVWNASVDIGGRFHRVSRDGGKTWSDPFQLTGEGGTEGLPQIALDGSGRLHLVVSYSGCAWHFTWEDNTWSEPVCTRDGDTQVINLFPTQGLDIEEPTMTISAGNQIHVVFWNNRERLWYTSARLSSARRVTAVPLYTRTPVLPTLTPTARPTRTATTAPPLLPGQDTIIPSANPAHNLFASLIPALALVGIVLALRLRASRDH